MAEGAAFVRTKGEAGTGSVVEAVRNMREIMDDIRRLQACDDTERATAAKSHQAPLELVRWVAEHGRLQLGAEGVFVGSGIFKSEDLERRACAMAGLEIGPLEQDGSLLRHRGW